MLPRVSRWFRLARPEYSDPTAQIVLGPVLNHRCRFCGEELWIGPHEFAQIAVTVVADERKPALEEFILATRNQDWPALSSFQDFDMNRDALEAFAIHCGCNDQLYVELVISPHELWARPEWVDEVTEIQNRAALEQVIPPESWRLFGPEGSA